MLSKFSVKKPYTVLVGVIAVLILGYVSFTKMTTDLLPDINLPYAIVLTSYPGASPSEVEEEITVPVEEAMATVSNVETVQSVSQENMSMVILQFSQSTDMDSASQEMRENLDMIDSQWSDSVASPMIMKLNPNMMPVMVAAVDKEGLDSIEVSDYAEDEIVPKLESIEGVASVSSSGNVEESIEVVLDEDKIKEVNEKVEDAVLDEFTKAQKKLDDAQEELDKSSQKLQDSKEELASGQTELDAGKEQLLNQLPQAQSQLDSAKEELLSNKSDLEDSLTLINGTLTVLDSSLEDGGLLDQAQDQLNQALTALDLDNSSQQLQEQKNELENQIQGWQQELEDATNQMQNLPDGDAKSQLEELVGQLGDYISQAQSAIEQIDSQLDSLTQSSQQLQEQQSSLDQTREELESQRQELNGSKSTLESYLSQIETGELTLNSAISQLNQQQLSATIEMANAQTQVLLGQAQIQQGETQLESGKEEVESGQKQLDEQKDQAVTAADLTSKLTVDTISQILTAQNFSMPAGYITEGDNRYLVRVGDKFSSLEELQDLVLFDLGLDGVDPIKLSDVAKVEKTNNSSEVYASVNGEPGVLLTMQKQTGYATSQVSKSIKEYFESAEEGDDAPNFTILMDQGIYIDEVVNAVLQNILYGAILAIIVLYLFLHDFRPTLIVACSIPISVVTALICMYFTGITLNIISLSGLALGVGMLVDNSIVVIENIYRLRALGYSRKKAAIKGAGQVGGAIIASTLTTIGVFLPIVFTEGITRQLFVDMGLTIAFSLLASLFIAMTLVPSMSYGMLRKPKEVSHPIFDRLIAAYEKVMVYVLRFKPVTLLAVLALLLLSAWLCISRGFIYFPDMESTQATVTLNMPDGAKMEESSATADEAIEKLQDISDVESIGAMAGSGSGLSMLGISTASSSSSADTVTMYLTLKDDKELSNQELEEEIINRTKDLNCEVEVSTSSMDMSSLTGSGVEVQIKGKDLDTLQEIAGDVAKIVKKVPGCENISDGLETAENEARIVVDKDKASKYNLTVAQVYKQIAAKISSSSSVTSLETDTKDYDVDVMDEGSESYSRDDIRKMKLTYTDNEGNSKKVALKKVADFADATGLTSISREGQSRYISVTADVGDDYNVTKVSNKVEKALESYSLPTGYTMKMTGENETIMDAMTQLMQMLLLAVILIYLIMVAQFQSLLSPFIVMFTIPLAFTGGFLGLLLSGQEFSIIAMIGFIMLSGIIVNNGIVLVDYINQLRESGMPKREAIIEAGKTRMRPIMMTALTTILGLTTMALGIGTGADMMQGMAVVTIGGLIYGTFLTLFVVPCIYDLLNRKESPKMLDKGEKGDYD